MSSISNLSERAAIAARIVWTTTRVVNDTNPSTNVTSFSIIAAAKTEPTATTKTKSNTFIFDSVLLPEKRRIMMRAMNPTEASVAERPTKYQLSKNQGTCSCGLTKTSRRCCFANLR